MTDKVHEEKDTVASNDQKPKQQKPTQNDAAFQNRPFANLREMMKQGKTK